MPKETINPSPTPQEQPFENTAEYRGSVRSRLQPRGQNEPGPNVTLKDGRTGKVTKYLSNLQTEHLDFRPEVQIQIDGEDRSTSFSLKDIEGF